MNGSGEPDIDGIQSLLALFGFEGHIVVFANFIFQARDVNEDLLSAILGDKSKAFGVVEKFDFSFFHCHF